MQLTCKEFTRPQDVVDMIQSYAILYLEEELERMTRDEYTYYTDADRARMQAMLADAKAVMAQHPWVIPN